MLIGRALAWSRSGSGAEENGTQIQTEQREFFLPRFVSTDLRFAGENVETHGHHFNS
jgi:hypothetical protein